MKPGGGGGELRKLLISKRNEKGWTQVYTAKLLGISCRMYQYIESGQREGKGRLWDMLQDIFNVNQRELRKITTDTNFNQHSNTRTGEGKNFD